ncbi:hypothetical protein D3C81_1833740 [compost metagenome]
MVVGRLKAVYERISERGLSIKCSFWNVLNSGISVEWTGIISPTMNNPKTNDCPLHFIRVTA